MVYRKFNDISCTLCYDCVFLKIISEDCSDKMALGNYECAMKHAVSVHYCDDFIME